MTARTALASIAYAAAVTLTSMSATAAHASPEEGFQDAGEVVKPSMSIKVGTSVCTLGFVLAGNDGMAEAFTAGHCGEIGETVTTESEAYIGEIAARGPDDIDVALIDIATTMSVYSDVDRVGPVVNVISVEQMNITRPLVCKRGRSTGLSCGPLVGRAEPGYFRFAALTEPGDSGAPVYVLTRTGKVHAAGVLEGTQKGEPGTAVATPIIPFMRAWDLQVAG